jgi:hypothetical protein
MTGTTRHVMVGVMTLGLTGAGPMVMAAELDDPPASPRVRSSHPSIALVITQAGERSPTFRRLVATISASDGTVYVEEGRCGHGVRTCLAAVTKAAGRRNLWVKVERNRNEWDFMGAIGHELQHAIEVLSDRTVTSNVAMFFFYRQTGKPHPRHLAFETDAAIEVGEAIRNEVRKYKPRTETQ